MALALLQSELRFGRHGIAFFGRVLRFSRRALRMLRLTLPLEGEGRRARKLRVGVGVELGAKSHPTPTLAALVSTLPLQGEGDHHRPCGSPVACHRVC